MKTLKIFTAIIILFLSVPVSNIAYATNDLTHEQMSKNYGENYTNTLLHSLYEANAKLGVKDEANKETINKLIDNNSDYIKSKIDDFGGDISYKDAFVELASGGLALGSTALDFFKKLFTTEDEQLIGDDYCSRPITQTGISGTYYSFWTNLSCGFGFSDGTTSIRYDFRLMNVETVAIAVISQTTLNEPPKWSFTTSTPRTLKDVQNVASKLGLTIQLNGRNVFNVLSEEEKLIRPILNNVFNRQIPSPSTRPVVYIPTLKPVATCPDGTKVISPDGKGGFIYANGLAADVSECTILWEKPKIDVNEDGEVIIKDNEKETIITEPSGEKCDTVLCFLAEIVKDITGMVGDLLDGLISVFVPDDLDFITEDFEKMKTKLLVKVEIITQLQDVMTGLFDTENSPALTYEIDMPALEEPIKMMDLEIIGIGLPIFKKVMSGVLILFTLFYVYRKITGDGGLMEK